MVGKEKIDAIPECRPVPRSSGGWVASEWGGAAGVQCSGNSSLTFELKPE